MKESLARQRLLWGLIVGVTAVCGLVVALVVALFLRHAWGVVSFPYELAAGEELLLRDAVQIVLGQSVYSDVNQFPFIVSNYPPLFALLSSTLLPLLGISLTATRAVSTLSTLLCACLIGAIAYQGSRAKVPSAICGGAFLGSTYVYEWGAWGRVDTMAILFSLAAILAVLRVQNWRGVCLGALFCVLSLYAKQTQFAAPLAILVWLLWRRKGRQALAFGAVAGGIGGLTFVLLNAWTSGQFFRHLVVYNALSYSPRALLGYWRAFGLTHGVLLGAAIVCGLGSFRGRESKLPGLYFVAAAALTALAGRAGASSNHFLELIAASLILCGSCWGRLWKRRALESAALALALLLQLVWFGAFPQTPLSAYYEPLPAFGYTPQPGDLASCGQIDRYVEGVQGPILTEGGGFALRNGEQVVSSPWLLSALEGTGLVDEGLVRLEENLREHRFSLVVLTWQSYPPRILEAVWANYQRVDTVDCVFTYEIFVPR